MKNDPRAEAAYSRLLERIDYGHLLAATDLAAFIEAVIERLDSQRNVHYNKNEVQDERNRSGKRSV